MFHNKFKQNDPVAEAIAQIAEADYKAKMEALRGDQHKLDKNKNNKLDAHDFAILRGEKKAVKEEEEEIQEGDRHALTKKLTNRMYRINKQMGNLAKSMGRSGIDTGLKDTKSDIQKAVSKSDDKVVGSTLSKFSKQTVKKEDVSEDYTVARSKVGLFTAPKKGEMSPLAKRDMNREYNRIARQQAKAAKAAADKKTVKEEEQLDELSKKTLGSYIKKSSDDFPQHQAKADAITSKANPHKPLPADAEKSLNKVWNRKVGIYRATDKLTKEEEQVEEGWDDMMKAAKERRGPQPSGGSGKKAGSRYGGSNQKREPVKERLEPNVKSHDGLKGPAPGESPNKMRSNKVKFVPEDRESEYSAHSELVKTASQDKEDKKFRLKDKKTGVTRGIFKTMAAAQSAHKAHPQRARLTVEEMEDLQELSKKTLGDYVKKASHDVAHKGALTRKHAMDSDAAKEKHDYVGARKSMEKADKTFAKSWKRREGMAKAVDRLTKEDVEQVDERELSKGETKEKERIVKGMKKSFAGFRARYGDRAKSVMYATATKAAKDD